MFSSIIIATLFTIGALAFPLAKGSNMVEIFFKTVIAFNETESQYSVCESNQAKNDYVPLKGLNNSAEYSKPGNYEDACVYHHNVHRANHSAPVLSWDSELASIAAQTAASCTYGHDTNTGGGGYGQNIAAGVEPIHVSEVISNLFYNEEVSLFMNEYGKADPDMSRFEDWGHFTQIVWKSTTLVGCATHNCSTTGLENVNDNVPPFFTVCNYKNPGNFRGQYHQNVLPPRGDATVMG